MDNMLFNEEFLRRLEQLRLILRRRHAGKWDGDLLSRLTGDGMVFDSHRSYTPGDDLRKVDWNVYARTGRYFLKEARKDQDVRVRLLVDSSASMGMGTPTKWQYAVQVVAALGILALDQGNRICFHSSGRILKGEGQEMSGASDVKRVLGALSSDSPSGIDSILVGLEQLAGLPDGTGAILVISDFLFDSSEARVFKVLKAKGFDVHVIQVLAPEEVEPTIVDTVTLEDGESGSTRTLFVGEREKQTYRESLHRHFRAWKTFLSDQDISWARVTSDQPLEYFILLQLRESGALA